MSISSKSRKNNGATDIFTNPSRMHIILVQVLTLEPHLSILPQNLISFDVSVLNGEGYKKLQSDSTFKTTFGVTLKPFKGFVLRGYYDIMKHNYAQTSYALFAGYTYKDFRAGVEYNIQKNNGMINNHDFSGISVYTALQLNEKYSIFARYDYLWSETITGTG